CTCAFRSTRVSIRLRRDVCDGSAGQGAHDGDDNAGRYSPNRRRCPLIRDYREPECPRERGDSIRVAAGQRELGQDSGPRDPPDPWAGKLGNPNIAVGPGGAPGRPAAATAAAGSPATEFGHHARRRDAPDLVPAELREPERVVRPDRNAFGARVG